MFHFDICLKEKKYCSFFFTFLKEFFSTLSSTQTIKALGLIFFLWADHENLDYEHAFQPYSYSLSPKAFF